MKRFLSLLLVLCMLLSLCTALAVTPAFAEDGIEETADIEDAGGEAAFDEALVKSVGINKEFSDDEVIDIELPNATDISGIRIYSQTDNTSSPAGSPKKWELYVSFDSGASYVYVDTDSAFGTSGTGFVGISDYESQEWTDEDMAWHKQYLPYMTTRLGYTIEGVTNVRVIVQATYDSTLVIPSVAVLKGWADADIDSYTYGRGSANDQVIAYQTPSFGASDVADGCLVTDEIKDVKPIVAWNAGRSTEKSEPNEETYAWGTAGQIMDGDLGSVAYTDGGLTIDLGEWVSVSGIRYYPPKNTDVENGDILFYIPEPVQASFDREAMNVHMTGAMKRTLGKSGQVAPYPTHSEEDGSTTTLWDAPISFVELRNPNFTHYYNDFKVRYIYMNVNYDHNYDQASPCSVLGEIRLLKPKNFTFEDEAELVSFPKMSYSGYGGFANNATTAKTITKSTNLNAGAFPYSIDGALTSVASNADYADLRKVIGADPSGKGQYGHLEVDFVYFRKFSGAYLDFNYDFGEGNELSASGIRFYNRVGYGSQAPTKVQLGVSDNGVDYLWSEEMTLAFTNRSYIENPSAHVLLDGEAVNLKGRYIKVRIKDTVGGEHCSFSEVAFLVPDDANETYTYTSYMGTEEEIKEKAAAISALIDAIGTVTAESGSAVAAARSAYDMAPTAVQDLVSNYDVLLTAEALYKSMMQVINVDQVNEAKYGTRNIVFTVSGASPVEAVSYKGEAIDESDYKVTANQNGTYTIEIGGAFPEDYYYTDFHTGAQAEDAVFAKANTIMGHKVGDTILGAYDGYAAHKIISDGLGDHILTVSFEDGTETTHNVKTAATWTNVGTTAYIKALADDEVGPATAGGWRAKTSEMNSAAINGLFDGNRTAGSYWESGYYSDIYSSAKQGVTNKPQVMVFCPAPIGLYLDMAKTTEISGFRFYRRNGNMPTDMDIYISEDGENWTFYENATFDSTGGTQEYAFKSKIATRYLWFKVNEVNGQTMGNSMSLSEITLTKPSAQIVGTKDFMYDSLSPDDVEDAVMAFSEDNGSGIAKVENITANKVLSASNYVGGASGITIKASYIRTLPIGTSRFKITLESGDTMTFTITLTDMSLSYTLSINGNALGSNNLTLVNSTNKEVAGVTLAGGPVSDYTVNGSSLTLPRHGIRSAADLYSLLGPDGKGEADLVVNYTDGTKRTYKVKLSVDWYPVSTPENGIFAEDEIASKTTWRVRTGSSNGYHPVRMFYMAAPKTTQNYHTSYTAIGSTVICDNGKQPHYIEIDLGENLEYSGLRYYARKDNIGDAWHKTTIYGSDDLINWVELRSVSKNSWKVGESYDFTFGKNVNYRYLRVKIDNESHATGNMLHLLQPGIFMALDEYTYDLSGVAGSSDLVVQMSSIGSMTAIAELTADNEAVDPSGYIFDAATKTITLKASYLKTLDTLGKVTYTVTADNGEKTTFVVEYYNSSIQIAEDELTEGTVYAAASKDGAGVVITQLTDRSTASAWNSASQTFVRYEFDEVTSVSGVRMYEDYSTVLAGKPITGKIYGTADGTTWFDIGNLCCVTSSGTTYTTDFGFNIDVKALAIEITKTRDNVAPVIDEMHVIAGNSRYATKTGSEVGKTELYVNGTGSAADSTKWTVTESSYYDDSEGSNLIDGSVSSIWHTDYEVEDWTITGYPGLPAYVVVDFNELLPVSGVRYTPRSGFASAVTRVNIYGSADGTTFNLIASDTYSSYLTSQDPTADVNRKTTMFGANYTLRAIKYEVVGTIGNAHATGAELEFYKPVTGDFTVEDMTVINPVITSAWTVSADSTAADSDIRYAFDGNSSTSWISGGADLPVTIEIDLGKATNISGIKFDSGTTKYTRAEIYVSEDGSNYTMFERVGILSGTTFTNVYDFLCNMSLRKVKLVITGADGAPFTARAIDLIPAKDNYQLITLSKEITDRSGWTAEADNALTGQSSANSGIDGQLDTIWHSRVGLPVSYTVHFGKSLKTSGFNYYPRRDDVGTQTTGNLRQFDIYVSSDNGASWDFVKTETYESQMEPNQSVGRVSQTLFEFNQTITDIRLDVTSGVWNYAVIGELAFLTPDSAREPKSAVLEENTFYFEVENPEDITLVATMNNAQRIKGLKMEGAPVDPNYCTIRDNTITLSKYFFEDYGYDTTETINFTVVFVMGNEAPFTVNVGGGNTRMVEYEAGEGGTMSAGIITQSGLEKPVASGDDVKVDANLTFVAMPDTGYEVDEWTVEVTTPIIEQVDRKGWKASASTTFQANNPASNMLDGNKTTYWHSNYNVVDGAVIPDPVLDAEHPYVITLDFGRVVENASALVILPRQDGTSYIRNYAITGTTDGETWFDITSGTLATGIAEKTIDFGGTYDLSALKFEIRSLSGSYAYIAEINMLRQEKMTGRETYRGTASAEYKIDSLFSDAKVSVTFKPMAEGTASVSQTLKNVTSDFTEKTVAKGSDFVMTFTPVEDYSVPASVTVKMGTTTLKENQDYTYDNETGVLIVKNVSGDISIIASGKEVGYYTVTYADSYGASGNLPEAQSVKGGRTFTAAKSSLVLTGYTFVGWSYNSTTYKAGAAIVMPEENIVLTAVWEKNSSGGNTGGNANTGNTGKPEDQGKKPGGGVGTGGTGMIGGGIGSGTTTQHTVTLVGIGTQKLATGTIIPDAQTPEGYGFIGWYLDEALTVPYSNQGLAGDVTLYPGYRKIRSRSELTDIQNHWAKDAIGDMYEAYIVNGKSEGIFDSDADITRAEFVQILYMMSGQTSDASESFADVNVGDWFLGAVSWAVNSGITQGITADTFAPYQKITREQMATMIYRYATQILGMDWQIAEDKTFTDSAEISAYAAYQVRWAADKGIVQGRPDGAFDPWSDATRAEAVTMLSRFLK